MAAQANQKQRRRKYIMSPCNNLIDGNVDKLQNRNQCLVKYDLFYINCLNGRMCNTATVSYILQTIYDAIKFALTKIQPLASLLMHPITLQICFSTFILNEALYPLILTLFTYLSNIRKYNEQPAYGR